jgi:hypothetical protein
MQMTTLRRNPQRAGAQARRRHHRARILASLIGVCENLSRLTLSREARQACREVAGFLDSALAREAGAAPRSRK